MKITAYKKDAQTIVVIINPETFPVNSTQLSGLALKSVTSYTTSETATLAKKTSIVKDNVVELDIAPYSVTTLVINN